MYPYEAPHYRAAGARNDSIYDTIGACGPMTAHMLAAEERIRDAHQYAAIWALTHPAGERTPGRFRGLTGRLLIRVGTWLQGAAPDAKAELTPATHGS
jgi:hypothetical protein